MTTTEILEGVIKRTGRGDIINIDTELNAVLNDITQVGDFLVDKKNITITPGKKEYDIEGDFEITGLKRIIELADSDGYTCEPIPCLKDILRLLQNNPTGQPTNYFLFSSNKLCMYPIPDDNYIFTIYYSYIHPSGATILLPDTFTECVIEGVCAAVWKNLETPEKANIHTKRFQEELKMLLDNLPNNYSKVVYRDV